MAACVTHAMAAKTQAAMDRGRRRPSTAARWNKVIKDAFPQYLRGSSGTYG
jgi:hypothetical protein